MKRFPNLALLTCLLFFWVGLTMVSGVSEKNSTMTYSELISTLEQQPKTVKSITIVNGSNEISIERSGQKPAHVVLPSKAGEQSVIAIAEKQQVPVVAKEASPGLLETILGILFNPLTMLLLIFWWSSRRLGAGGPLGKFQQSGATVQEPTKPGKTTFADVAGCKEAKEELEEVVEYLRDPSTFLQMGAKLPRGILLVGSPGNGKTLLAKAVAGEAGVPFFALSASQFVEMLVGAGAARARDLFQQARKRMPCIIFIDEIDAVGRHRGTGFGGGHDEREQTLNEILVQMDGFVENDAIVLIAATNRPDILDPAITRSGRFDRHIMVDSPDIKARAEIFKVHMRNRPLASDVDPDVLARITPGFSGADIATACNEASTVARRRYSLALKSGTASERMVTMEDFSEGVDRVLGGPAREHFMSESARRNTAVHEVGHAAVGHVLKGNPIRKVTIAPRARALGFTLSAPEEEQTNRTREELLNEIASIMGGRLAQEIILNITDTGAVNDFQQATALARRMVTMFGMSSLGHISISEESSSPFLGRTMSMGPSGSAWGPAIMDRVDAELQQILSEGSNRARRVIEERREDMERVVQRLLEKETVLGDEFVALFDGAAERGNS